MTGTADDAWSVTVVTTDLDVIQALKAAPPPEQEATLTPGPASRIPGATETIAQILAHVDGAAVLTHLDSGATGVVGSLIAAWLWQAFHKAPPKAKAHLTIRRLGKRIDVQVEGQTVEEAAMLLKAAMDHAGLGR